MTPRLRSLSGHWQGRYAYSGRFRMPPCAFNATLEEKAGALSGETIEPNTFAPVPLDTLVAGIAGSHEGPDVYFRKTYVDFETSTILYEGELNPTGNRIDGTWRISGYPWVRGTFMMARLESAARRKAAVVTEAVE